MQTQLRHKNSKKQGDFGLGVAIGWATRVRYTVAIPLTDSQDYDLLIDDGTVKRVQVKTTTYRSRHGVYVAHLTVSGGNRSWNGVPKKLNPATIDLLFIVTADFQRYLFPVASVQNHAQLHLGRDKTEYLIVD
jgi:PD-(D/E)XK nuclease superfamily protein